MTFWSARVSTFEPCMGRMCRLSELSLLLDKINELDRTELGGITAYPIGQLCHSY